MAVLWPFLALAVVRSSWSGCSGASVKLSSPAKEYASELVQTWLSCPYDSPEEDIAVARCGVTGSKILFVVYPAWFAECGADVLGDPGTRNAAEAVV